MTQYVGIVIKKYRDMYYETSLLSDSVLDLKYLFKVSKNVTIFLIRMLAISLASSCQSSFHQFLAYFENQCIILRVN